MKKAITIYIFIVIIQVLGGDKALLRGEKDDQRKREILDQVSDGLKKVTGEYSDQADNLKSALKPHVIDKDGQHRKVKLKEALDLYVNNVKVWNSDHSPFFEIKKTKKVILPVFGIGLWDHIWGNIVVDKETLVIEKVELLHLAETPGLGAMISETEFEKQFENLHLKWDGNNYSLYQNDKEVIHGRTRIDGISGATITSTGAVNMMNSSIHHYKKYFN